MNIKPKIEAVPTAAQLLRDAIAYRDSTVTDMEAIRAKTQHFAPIEAEVTAAEGELQRVLQHDADAMQKWVDAGASGAAPEPEHKARENAARKVSDARAKLNATGHAKGQIESDVREAHERHLEAVTGVRSAESNVLGEELLRSASAMKAAALVYLAAEQHYFAIRTTLLDADPVKATPIASQAGEIGRPMNVEEERKFIQQTLAKSRQRCVALCQGQDPADAPQVTA